MPYVNRAAFAAAVLLWTSAPASAEPCTTSNLSSFSRLGQVVEAARLKTPGKLLATWLLRSRTPGDCRFIFRVDLLLTDGRVHSMNFDAETLDPVEIDDERGWEEAGAPGVGGGKTSGTGSAAVSPDDDDDDDDDDEDDSEDDNDSEESGEDDGGDDDGGDDDGGDDNGGDDGSGDDGSGDDGGGDDGGGDDGGDGDGGDGDGGDGDGGDGDGGDGGDGGDT